MDKNKRRESGAQLLARLSARPDIYSIDPSVFGPASSSKPHSVVNTASCGQIIEIYGSEGVGKTEVALHYIAKACLPYQWKNVCINGKGAKVVIIDTDFKFSVLRLAIVLEKQILSLIERLKKCKDKQSEISNSNYQSCSLHHNIEANLEHEKRTISNLGSARSVSVKATKNPTDCESACKEISPIVQNEGGKQGLKSKNGISIKDEEICYDIDMRDNGAAGKELKDESDSNEVLTPQEIEDLVQDTLGRVQVLQVHSSEQLLASLQSLEMTLTCDPLIAMVVIDSISAFYWTDKLADPEKSQTTELRMSPIASTLSKYACDCGVTFVVVKSALIAGSGKRNWKEDQEMQRKKDKSRFEHVEFLGKSWSNLPVRRLVLSKSCDGLGQIERVMWCSEWSESEGKHFTFSDDSLHFL